MAVPQQGSRLAAPPSGLADRSVVRCSGRAPRSQTSLAHPERCWRSAVHFRSRCVNEPAAPSPLWFRCCGRFHPLHTYLPTCCRNPLRAHRLIAALTRRWLGSSAVALCVCLANQLQPIRSGVAAVVDLSRRQTGWVAEHRSDSPGTATPEVTLPRKGAHETGRGGHADAGLFVRAYVCGEAADAPHL